MKMNNLNKQRKKWQLKNNITVQEQLVKKQKGEPPSSKIDLK